MRFMARVAASRVAVILMAGALSGCATYSSPPVAGPATRALPDSTGKIAIAAWQVRLGQHIEGVGGDPAVLAHLSALRSPAVTRPAQILFGATDIEALVPERDGFDVFGLLVGKHSTSAGPRYVFIVGVVERQDYWPVTVGDVRVVAMAMKGGVVTWETGPADVEALMRYRARSDTSTAVRFPAVKDQFRVVACDPGVCVEEVRSGARWALYSSPNAVMEPAQRPVPSAAAMH
jgi:hypothetical protein